MDEEKSELLYATSICGHLCHLWMSFSCPIKVKLINGLIRKGRPAAPQIAGTARMSTDEISARAAR